MHAKIYQLATKPISRDEYMSPNCFYENHDAYADWVGDEMKDEERTACVKRLADDLKEIFYLEGEALVYRGKPAMREFRKRWVEAIHEKAFAVKPYSVTKYAERATLRDIVDSTHKNSSDRFCIEEWSGDFAESMAELITFADHKMRKGQRLHIGAVIDFHYS